MPAEWYCRVMGSELGPFTSAELLEMARNHRLSPEDSVRRGTDGSWISAYRVKGLFEDAAGSVIIKAVLPPEAPKRENHAGPGLKGPQHTTVHKHAHSVSPVERGDWYCISSGSKRGPMSFEQLRRLAALGELQPADRVWCAAVPTKHQAREIKGLGFGSELTPSERAS